MNVFAQLGQLIAVNALSPIQFADRFQVGRRMGAHWGALLVLVCMSAAFGGLLQYLYVKAWTRKRDGRSALSELAMLRTVVANLPDPIYVKDTESRFLMANEGTAKNAGASSVADLLGKTDFDFFPQQIAAGFREDELRVLVTGQPQVSKEEHITDRFGQKRCLLSTKVPLFDATGKIAGLIGIGRNITTLKDVEAELRRVQAELTFKAAHDSLTALLNREAILEMLERELARSAREDGATAVLLGDLDHFKEVNDTLGHPTGDEILREVARRLVETVRAYDFVGRIGGEEFLVVLPGCETANVRARANQLREAIAASPIPTTCGSISMTISVGAIVAEEWGRPTSADILREVDKALYAAKAAGRNRCWLAAPSVE